MTFDTKFFKKTLVDAALIGGATLGIAYFGLDVKIMQFSASIGLPPEWLRYAALFGTVAGADFIVAYALEGLF